MEKFAIKIFLISGRWSLLGAVFWGCEGKAALATALLCSAKQQWGTESWECERDVKFVKFFTVFTIISFLFMHFFRSVFFIDLVCHFL